MRDGWHTIAGKSVYIENGKIRRGMTNNDTQSAWVYRWNKAEKSWVAEGPISPAAFRAGIKRGTLILT